MKVALVHDFLVRLGGAERVLATLSRMYPDAPIYTLLYDEKKVGSVFPRERIVPSFLQSFPRWVRDHHRLLFPLMPLAIERFDLSGFDLVISSSNSYAHGVLTGTETKHICYCHSPMRYCWDWAHKYLAENHFSYPVRRFLSERLHRMRLWDKAAADRPDVYIANSQNTQKRILKYYRLPSEVVYPPVDISRFSASHKDEGFFVIVSTLTPFKKIDLAVDAFNRLGDKLFIIGDGSQRSALQAKAKSNIVFTGFLSDTEVASYISRCKAFIFPGEEDFGIAPVEAMASGKPVIAYAKGGLLESVKDGQTGIFFSDSTSDALRDAVLKLKEQGVSLTPQEIRKRSERFSISAFQEGIRRIVHHICQ